MEAERTGQNRYLEALTRKGWTLARGAAEAGYSYSYFALMVREPRLMSDQMARHLAGVLGLASAAEARNG
jgi:lambda repressor-like predicted transcriptional regulator